LSVPSIISRLRSETDLEPGVFISLGSNLSFGGYSSQTLISAALNRLELGGDKVIATSSLWKSDAWPKGQGAPDFINAVCRIYPFDRDPERLLRRLHVIEDHFGRVRDPHNRWPARTLDLDLLDYNGLISEKHSFYTLPHPRIASRDFVLLPLLEVSPYWKHPITSKDGQILLNELIVTNQTHNCQRLAQ
jgi:2-amino-4-hydroxy-6-hydroxymethyldihydropteridine diphosphokinase